MSVEPPAHQAVEGDGSRPPSESGSASFFLGPPAAQLESFAAQLAAVEASAARERESSAAQLAAQRESFAAQLAQAGSAVQLALLQDEVAQLRLNTAGN